MKWTGEVPRGKHGIYWQRSATLAPSTIEIDSSSDGCDKPLKSSEYLGPITPAQAEMWDDLLHALLHARNRNHEHAADACTGCEMVDALLNRAKQVEGSSK